MHYVVPLVYYTRNFVIEEVLHYIQEFYKFSHKCIKKYNTFFLTSFIKFLRVPYPGAKYPQFVDIFVGIVVIAYNIAFFACFIAVLIRHYNNNMTCCEIGGSSHSFWCPQSLGSKNERLWTPHLGYTAIYFTFRFTAIYSTFCSDMGP